MSRITKKFVEAQVLRVAKALGMGVVGIDAKRAAEFGVPVATFVRKGELIPGCRSYADTAGYYAPRSNPLGVPKRHLTIDAHSPGDGWTRYRLAELGEPNTAHYDFSGYSMSCTLAEFSAYLRGIECGAHAAKVQP